MIKFSLIFCVFAPLLGCRSITTNQNNPALGMPDTIAIAQESGVNYVELTAKALNRSESSLHRLFMLTNKFDGASSDGHSGVLRALLTRTGDDFFGMQLAREPDEVRNDVHNQLLYDFGWGSTEIRISELKRWYPKTFAQCHLTD